MDRGGMSAITFELIGPITRFPIFSLERSSETAPVGMYIQAGGDVPETNNDSAKITRDYIDIVQRMTAQPGLNQLYTNYFGFPILECWLYTSIMNDCNEP